MRKPSCFGRCGCPQPAPPVVGVDTPTHTPFRFAHKAQRETSEHSAQCAQCLVDGGEEGVRCGHRGGWNCGRHLGSCHRNEVQCLCTAAHCTHTHSRTTVGIAHATHLQSCVDLLMLSSVQGKGVLDVRADGDDDL